MPILYFRDNSFLNIDLIESPLKSYVLKFLKHLQHVDIDFKEWDNPYYIGDPVSSLLEYAKDLNITIDTDNIKHNQTFLNYLHEIYEKNYDGDPQWLKFHEQIHRCEQITNKTLVTNLEWREKGGLLNSTIMPDIVESSGKTQINYGDICIEWSELGKRPIDYWVDGEPNDINRICELAKPWKTLRPKMAIYLEDCDKLETVKKDQEKYEKWWNQYKEDWCNYWGLNDYKFDTQFKVIKIGTVNDIDTLNDKLTHLINPMRISL
jgi:hypothetical protein